MVREPFRFHLLPRGARRVGLVVRKLKYGPWEIADVDGNWTVVMNGIDAATVARLVEVPGPSFRYYELREPGLTSTYMRWVETYDPEGPPEPLYTYWVDGEWRTGPLPSENELAMLRRIPRRDILPGY